MGLYSIHITWLSLLQVSYLKHEVERLLCSGSYNSGSGFFARLTDMFRVFTTFEKHILTLILANVVDCNCNMKVRNDPYSSAVLSRSNALE